MPEITEPEDQWFEKPIKTEVYHIATGWYIEVVVAHPDNPEMPNQSMTIKCDNEWWARFLEYTIDHMSTELLLDFDDDVAPEFRYEG